MPADPCPHHDSVVSQAKQYGAEIRELLISNTELKADVRNLTYEFGRFEKSVTAALSEIRADLQTQREADAARDVSAAKIEVKTNLFWTLLIDQKGWVVLASGAVMLALKGCG